MHGATFKLVLAQRQYMLSAHTELLLQIIDGYWVIFNAEKHFQGLRYRSPLSQNAKK